MAPPASDLGHYNTNSGFNPAAAALKGEVEVWSLTFAVAESMALKTVVVLGVPDIIAKAGPDASLSTKQIAAKLPAGTAISTSNLDRILQLLAAKGVFSSTGDEESRYGLNNASKWLVTGGNEFSMAPIVLMNTDKAFEKAAHFLPEAVLEGGSAFEKANGADLFTFTQGNAEFKKVLESGIASSSRLAIEALLKQYHGFKDLKSLVEISNEHNEIQPRIKAAYPNLHVIKQKLQHGSSAAEQAIPSADGILLTSALHFRSDDTCCKLLSNCHKSLPANGKLIILEPILSHTDSQKPSFGSAAAMMDIFMIANTAEGTERTKEQLEKLIKAAGFSQCKFIETTSLLQAIEATK